MNTPRYTRAKLIKQADEIIAYYQGIIDYQQSTNNIDNSISSMWLGLYMSKQWRRLLDEPRPDLEELKLFLKALERNGDWHGSQWLNMSLIVMRWLDALEQESI